MRFKNLLKCFKKRAVEKKSDILNFKGAPKIYLVLHKMHFLLDTTFYFDIYIDRQILKYTTFVFQDAKRKEEDKLKCVLDDIMNDPNMNTKQKLKVKYIFLF